MSDGRESQDHLMCDVSARDFDTITRSVLQAGENGESEVLSEL